ncbi:hypothetical protein V1525DRAFT_445946 [Lipomyces kononenkoae]|uniref:Uncharacterized protein n=1 Tax=Lipomyces kononenkoae TaxID=34357 RepID=A0ACC3SWE7_LIPKO
MRCWTEIAIQSCSLRVTFMDIYNAIRKKARQESELAQDLSDSLAMWERKLGEKGWYILFPFQLSIQAEQGDESNRKMYLTTILGRDNATGTPAQVPLITFLEFKRKFEYVWFRAKILFCVWHLYRAWDKQLKEKITGIPQTGNDVRKELKQVLRELRNAPTTELFDQKWRGFRTCVTRTMSLPMTLCNTWSSSGIGGGKVGQSAIALLMAQLKLTIILNLGTQCSRGSILEVPASSVWTTPFRFSVRKLRSTIESSTTRVKSAFSISIQQSQKRITEASEGTPD